MANFRSRCCDTRSDNLLCFDSCRQRQSARHSNRKHRAAAFGLNVDSLYAVVQQEFVKLEPIWQKACYDCHTDKTDYPWYYKLPFVKGMIDKDIEEARAELDMSKGFPFISQRKPVDDIRKLGAEFRRRNASGKVYDNSLECFVVARGEGHRCGICKQFADDVSESRYCAVAKESTSGRRIVEPVAEADLA